MGREEVLHQGEEVGGVGGCLEGSFSPQEPKEEGAPGGISPCGAISLLHSGEGIHIIGEGVPPAAFSPDESEVSPEVGLHFLKQELLSLEHVLFQHSFESLLLILGEG